MNRRTFAATAVAAAGLAVPGLVGASTTEAATPAAGRGSQDLLRLRQEMVAALASDLDDRATAVTEVPRILDICFTWEPPTVEVAEVDFLVAYSFGNRAPAGGGDPTKVLYEPGPVNESLADTVARVRRRKDVPVYAQWEIAHFLTGKYGMKDVTAINPVIAADGTITYLSTYGAAAQVVAARKSLPGGIGTAGVIGFRDHVKRCVETTRLAGVPDSGAPAGYRMPGSYDPQSGQAWTRTRDLYLVHDMSAQWQMLEAELVAAAGS